MNNNRINKNDFNEKIVVITGAASGIGEACLDYFAKQGSIVIGLDNQEDKILAKEQKLSELGHTGKLYKVDITNKKEIEDAIDDVVSIYGGLDYWINAAGISYIIPFLETSEEIWDRTLDVNLKGQFLCCQVAIKHMIKNNGGAIVNFSSQSGKKGTNEYAAYCSSKAGVIALTQSIAKEFGEYNIRCNDICPGVVYTPMWDKQIEDYARKKKIKSDEVMKTFEQNTPLKRIASLEDVTNLVWFLLSDKSSYMTGQSINLTGGSWMW